MRTTPDRPMIATTGRRIGFGVLATALLAPLWLPVILFSLPDRYDFQGQGWAYWLLVRNSNADRIGLVEPSPTLPVAYSISFQEGTFPGWTVVDYRSDASPARIHETYRERCGALRFPVTRSETTNVTSFLTCEMVRYLDIEVSAERKADDPLTQVTVRVWGR